MARIKFVSGTIEKAVCDSSKSASFLWDSEAPGLGLRVANGGAKRYIFQAKVKKQREVIRIRIGDVGTWTIEQARGEARRLKVLMDGGHDPRQIEADNLAAKQADRDAKQAVLDAEEAKRIEIQIKQAAEKTKRELIARVAWNAYLDQPRPPSGKKKWGAQHRADHIIAANAGGDLCKIGGKKSKAAPLASLLAMPLHSITAQVIEDWLSHECKTRPTFAHNSFRKFRAFIGWCANHPDFKQAVHMDCCLADAVKDITPSSKTKDGDCLQREQLADWFTAMRRIRNPVISAYLQGLLITGARRGELALLRWEDVDFKWNRMNIRDKVEDRRDIPLTPYLAHLFTSLPRRNAWVFSSTTAASGHITEPRIAHTSALQAAGLPHVSLHGLRRSFGTLSEWVEVPIGVVAQIQGHKPSSLAEKHYRRRPIDLLRMWHTKIENWVLEQAGIDFVTVREGLRAVN